MTADWATADYYALLDVPQNASPEALKRAYRRMAHLHHPDANPDDPEAPDRFRRVAEAYAILSDQDQKGAYDRLGTPEYRSRTPDAPDLPSVEDLISASGAILGRHIITPITVPLEHVVKGASVTVEADDLAPVEVDIPAGVEDGDIVRIEGKGRIENGVAGDIIVIVNVPRHAFFSREGDDIRSSREVNVSDLALGTAVSVSTLHGSTTLPIPPGTQPGQVFVIEGFGVRYPDGRSGDMIVQINASSSGDSKRADDRNSFAGLVDVLDGDDVEVIPTVGTPFNSDVHEVAGKVEPGEGRLVVTGEIRRGYRVKGQVIRPAMVTVTRQVGCHES